MANAPAVLEAYLTMSEILGKTSFSPAEQQLILLTASVRNGCKYCVAAHSSGGRMAKLDKQAIEAVRDGEAIEDTRLQALRFFTEHQIETRGKVDPEAIENFLAAGGAHIAFFAAPGQVAKDGVGSNSSFTEALVETIRQPGLAIEQVFKRTRISVRSNTGNEQTP